MGGDLVEQDEGRDAAHRRDQPGMGERQPDQQRLLLAGRGAPGLALLGAVAHDQVARLRPDQRAAGGGVAGAIVAQQGAKEFFGFERRALRRPERRFRLRARYRPRERASPSSRPAAISAASRSTVSRRAAATAMPSSAISRSAASSQIFSPRLSSSRRLRLRRARSIALDPRAMLAVHRQHQPVEKAPPLPGGAGEQPVHGRGEPDDADMVGEGAGRGNRLAVEAEFFLDAALGRRLERRSPVAADRPPRRSVPAIWRSRRSPPSRASSAVSARRRPRPGVKSEIASSRLVLPAPFSPESAAIGLETRRSSAA